jgi:methyl-accepting chemotaxis protein
MKNILKRLSINTTIIFLSVFLFSLQAIYGTMINYSISIMGNSISQIETQYIPLTKDITLLTEHQLKQEIVFERGFRYALVINEDDSLQKFNEAKSEFLLLSNKINGEIEHTIKRLVQYMNRVENEEVNKQFALIKQQLNDIKGHHEIWDNEMKNIFQLLHNDDMHNALEMSKKAEKHAIELKEEVIHILAEIEEYTEQAIHILGEEDHNIFLTGIVMLIISFLMAIIITRFITVNITEDLDELKVTITNISAGDLFTNVTSKLGNEFGIEKMRERLHNILLLVQNNADEMTGASNELSQVSITVMENVNRQAEEVDLVSAAMTEMEATSMEVARHAESTQSLTVLASQKANESYDITKKAMTSMSDLTTSLDESSHNIQKLEQHSTNISSVLTVIKGIADQTNLLALNAAIEAARAGEQGRGFAVVADEVRTLAQRTQDSTIQIEEMVHLFTNGTTQAVHSMKMNSDYGKNSHHAAEESNQKIEDIQTTMESINEMNNQIATAAEEQSCTSQELSRNTVKISKLSSENIDSFAQVSAASEQLYSLATQLKNNIEKFKLM